MRYMYTFLFMVAASVLLACNKAEQATPSPSGQTTLPAASKSVPQPVAVAPATSEVIANDNCDINAPKPGGTFDRTEKLAVWGYAFDKSTWAVPPAVSIRIASLHADDKLTVLATRGARRDVAEAFKRRELENSGFGIEVDVAALAPGSYLVSVLQEIGGKVYVCNSPLPIAFK